MNRPLAWSAVALVLAGSSACGGGWSREPMPPLGPTLEIINRSGLVYRVTVGPGVVVQLYPGDAKCVRVGKIHKQRRIEFYEMAGAARYYTPLENLMSESGWVVEIGELPTYDVLSLRPSLPCEV